MIPTDLAQFSDWLWRGESNFVAGAATYEQLPKPLHAEIAFLGRSNVGKSSLLNALLGRKKLAYISHTPGSTQQLNFFSVRDLFYAVDVPGYGYAKVSRTEAAAWQRVLDNYLRERKSLIAACILIDARRGVMDVDRAMLDSLDEYGLSYQLVLTKAESIKAAQLQSVLEHTMSLAPLHPAMYPEVIATSSRTGQGISSLQHALAPLIYRFIKR